MLRIFSVILLCTTLSWSAAAQSAPEETSVEEIEVLILKAPDPRWERRADEMRVSAGRTAHFAAAVELEVSPWKQGAWDALDLDRARWRLRVVSPGALSLSFAFQRFVLPPGAHLTLRSAAGDAGPYTDEDQETHGELWTPPLNADEVLLELIVPIELLGDVELQLTRAHHGYAGFGEAEPKSGACEVDVACVQSDAWLDASRSVALLAIEGVRYCTGFLINNTAMDGRPLLMTAHHCGIDARNAASVVVFWNHQKEDCGVGEAPAMQTQTGAEMRAAWPSTDMVLLELDDLPDPSFDVRFAGWDRSAVEPRRTAVIHHPNTDVKRIAVDLDRAVATQNFKDRRNLVGSHLRVGHWETGTTEGGSSGAPLFNQDLRVVGQLQGGYAACGNRSADWFGRLYSSWTGGGRKGLRLSDWLDPLGTGAVTLDGVDASDLVRERELHSPKEP